MPTVLDREAMTALKEVEFVMSHVAESDDMRDEFMPVWIESLENYLVKPFSDNSYRDKDYPLLRNQDSPFSTSSQSSRHGKLSSWSVLKDSESHQVVETMLDSVMNELFGEPGFIQARRVGFEDTFKASTATKLLEHDLATSEHYRAFYQWIKDALIFGTGILMLDWDYEEAPVTQRTFEVVGGFEVSSEFTENTVVRDSARLTHTDLLDFYPSPGQPLLSRMTGAAVRFEMTAREALDNSNNLEHWDKEAVKRAISASRSDARRAHMSDDQDSVAFEGLDRPEKRTPHPDFLSMVGFEYYGEVPWRLPAGEDRWKVITVLNGERVAKRDWHLSERRLPFYDLTIKPIGKRFYGVSPLEVSRFTQDFLDTILNCLADGTIKMTHPPWLVDRNARVPLEKLKDFHPNVAIHTDIMDGIEQLTYNPPLGVPAAIFEQQKQSIRERTGASNVEQGLGFTGVPRSASAASIEAGKSSVRPAAFSSYIERVALPPIGRGLLKINQQFIADSEDLMMRVGEIPTPFPIQEIMGDHDLKFVGSRQQHNRQTRRDSLERIGAMVAQSPVAQIWPWMEYFMALLEANDLHELQAMVGDPQRSMAYTILGSLARGGSLEANNGVQEQPAQQGLTEAQGLGRQLA